ncbi:MAG: hypothetical protein K1X57_13455 [Gemmataceae bacterium]|nr:hypothetical protein [Gemmataceae bacterium]
MLTPDRCYWFNSAAKVLWIIDLSRYSPGIQPETEFLKLLGGINAEGARQRYDIALAKEDQHYAYFFISPRTKSDREAFSKARLVLWNTTFLPRQLEFDLPNGGSVKWDIPVKVKRGELTWAEAGRVTMADFAPPQPPEGWKVLGPPPSLPAADVPCATELPSTSQNCCPPRRFRFRRGHCR